MSTSHTVRSGGSSASAGVRLTAASTRVAKAVAPTAVEPVPVTVDEERAAAELYARVVDYCSRSGDQFIDSDFPSSAASIGADCYVKLRNGRNAVPTWAPLEVRGSLRVQCVEFLGYQLRWALNPVAWLPVAAAAQQSFYCLQSPVCDVVGRTSWTRMETVWAATGSCTTVDRVPKTCVRARWACAGCCPP